MFVFKAFVMKRKVLWILSAVIILRLLNIFVFNNDPLFYLSPRNFNGRGLLVAPNWLDFVIILIVIILLWPKSKNISFNTGKLTKPLFVSFSIILTPIITGLLLNNYLEKIYTGFEFNTWLVLKYLLFILTFIAVNLWADQIKLKNKFIKFIILTTGIFFLAYTQDFFGSGNPVYILLALLNSTGLTLVLLSIALRKFYKEAPLESLIAVIVAAIFNIFFVFSALSVSYFTIFLPFAGILTISLIWYKIPKKRTTVIIASLPFLIAVFLNYGLPGLLPEKIANELIEHHNREKYHTAQYKEIIVKYKSPELKEIAIGLAKVINAANKISQKEFGYSPQVKELIIKGFGEGGFHAEMPGKIVGKIISKKYIEKCLDSSFLNNPALSPDFPDPVNAILHEYSHLFGTIPYHKWYPGPEEEGWATYSATRLSKLLYNGQPGLWQPAYNFSNQASKITKLNLSGRAVAWSHPHEFGGFNLWYHLEKNYGLKDLYQKRLKVSRRDLKNGALYYVSDPQQAKKVVKVFGKENFLKYGQFPPFKFGQRYSKETYLYLAKTTGMDTTRILKIYQFMKNRMVNPSVPIPK